jgi:hypothetical protein
MSKYEQLVHGDAADYTEITARLRLRKYGSWLIGDKKKQDKIAKDRSRQLLAIVQLAKKISVEKGVSVDEAYIMINSADSGENANITADYIEEVVQIVEAAQTQTDSDAQILTMFLQSRGEGLFDGEWKRLVDWSEEDTDVLDGVNREKIVQFINDEQSGGSEVKDEEDEEDQPKASEGNEKKSSATGSKSKSTASESSSSETIGMDATQGSPLVV